MIECPFGDDPDVKPHHHAIRSSLNRSRLQVDLDVDGSLDKLLDDMVLYLRSPKHSKEAGHVVYDGFAALADKIKAFTPQASYTKPGEGGLSRLNLYLRDIMLHFEEVRAVRDSETPIGLRLFCFALIHISPVLLAPYWNHFCAKQTATELPSQYGCESGLLFCMLLLLVEKIF